MMLPGVHVLLASPFFPHGYDEPSYFLTCCRFISPAQHDASEIKKRGWEAIRVKARCEFQAWLRVFLLLLCLVSCRLFPSGAASADGAGSPSDEPLLVPRECSHSPFPGQSRPGVVLNTQCSVSEMFSSLYLFCGPGWCLFAAFSCCFSPFLSFFPSQRGPSTLCLVCAAHGVLTQLLVLFF